MRWIGVGTFLAGLVMMSTLLGWELIVWVVGFCAMILGAVLALTNIRP